MRASNTDIQKKYYSLFFIITITVYWKWNLKHSRDLKYVSQSIKKEIVYEMCVFACKSLKRDLPKDQLPFLQVNVCVLRTNYSANTLLRSRAYKIC